MNIIRLLIGFSLIASFPAHAGQTTGKPSNVATSAVGVYVIPSGGLPSDCSTSTNGWLLIPAANQAMIAHLLQMKAQGLSIRLTTDGTRDAQGYCYVIAIYDF